MGIYRNPMLCKSQNTGQQTLYLALTTANKHGITDAILTNRYDLNRPMLGKIRDGQQIPRKYDKYLSAMVRALNDHRIVLQGKDDAEKLSALEHDMLDILLVDKGIATDMEMQVMDKEYRRQLTLQSLRCKVSGS